MIYKGSVVACKSQTCKYNLTKKKMKKDTDPLFLKQIRFLKNLDINFLSD